MKIISQLYKGNVIIEYPHMIFDSDIYQANEYSGTPLEFQESNSIWINIQQLLKQNKKFPSIEILKYINLESIKLKIYADENHNILKIEIKK